MDQIEGIRSQQEQTGLESDSSESADAALATGVTTRRQRTKKGKPTSLTFDGKTVKLSIK